MILINVLGVLGVLNVLNVLNVLYVLYVLHVLHVLHVLNMLMDASLACWALFIYPPLSPFFLSLDTSTLPSTGLLRHPTPMSWDIFPRYIGLAL